MWKWIAGGVAVLLLLLIGTCYWGLKKFSEGGGSSVVMIGASPDRVFASLADPDSLTTWVDVGSMVASSRHGLLQAGDSFRIARPARKSGVGGDITTWRVVESVPGRSLMLRIANDSLGKVAIISRYDSLSIVGDSTRLSTTYGAETLDSTRLSTKGGGKTESAVLGFAQKLIVAALRLATETDLQRLKARVEQH